MRVLYAMVLFGCIGLMTSCGTSSNLRTETTQWPLHIIDSSLWGADGIRVGDFNGDEYADYISGGEEKGLTKVYLGRGGDGFNELTFESADVEDAIFFDGNGDGRSEVMTLCEGRNEAMYWHFLDSNDVWVNREINAARGKKWMYSATANFLPNGSHQLVVGGKGDNAIVGWMDIGLDYEKSSEWPIHFIDSVGWIMSIEVLDIDGDGDEDVVVSDRKGNDSGVKWYENPGSDKIYGDWEVHDIGLMGQEVMFLTVLDFDNDDVVDVVAADIESGVYLLTRTEDIGGLWEESLLFAYPEGVGERGKSVAVTDINGDGQKEVFTSYEMAEDLAGIVCSSYDKVAKTWVHDDIGGSLGIKYDKILLHDVDGDGDLDLMTTEERSLENGLGVIWYENPGVDSM
ncbi:hypothetical protein GCM10025777_12320 [Membranihabitans marinus]